MTDLPGYDDMYDRRTFLAGALNVTLAMSLRSALAASPHDDLTRLTLESSAQAALIVPGATVIVIAEYADAAAHFDNVFARFGLRGVRKGSERIETKLGPLYLTFLEAKARAVS